MAQQQTKHESSMQYRAVAHTLTAIILLGLLIGYSAYLQNTKYEKLKADIKEGKSKSMVVGHLPSGKHVKTAVFGYDTVSAHVLWLRSIQYFGGIYRSAGREYKPILHLFDVITELEPNMIDAYTFGAMVLGEEANDHEKALEILDKGIHKNPRKHYVLAYNALFQCAYNKKDWNQAKYYCKIALKAEDCPDWVSSVCTYIDVKNKFFKHAFHEWFTEYLEAEDRGDEFMSNMRFNRSQDVLSEWALEELNIASKKFEEQEKRKLKNLTELVDNRYLKDFEIYSWDKIVESIEALKASNRPLAQNKEAILANAKIKGNFLPSWTSHPKRGYFVYQQDGKIYKNDRLSSFLANQLGTLRQAIKKYTLENKKYPQKLKDIKELLDENGELNIQEPTIGKWIYDPDTGVVQSPAMRRL